MLEKKALAERLLLTSGNCNIFKGGANMSRIGFKPIELPKDVEIKVDTNNIVTVKGPKGTLSEQIHRDMLIKNEESSIVIERPTDNKKHKSLHGLSRTLISNMVDG